MIARKNYLFLFFILFAHITVLNLFFVTLNGPVFLFKENLQLVTILTHATIALTCVVFCFLLQIFRIAYKTGRIKFKDNIFIVFSFILVVAIYWVLFK